MKENNQFPRRNKVYEMNPAELAIYNAMGEVEKMPADVKLTESVTLLSKAKDLVSDFIDGVDVNICKDEHFYKCPECGDVWMTHSKSPDWLINQAKLGIHLRNDMKIPCRTEKFVEITKEEFIPLHEQLAKKQSVDRYGSFEYETHAPGGCPL